MAMVMRTELAVPGLQVVDDLGYDQLFTMHGTIMLLLFGTPMAVGLGELHRAAPDRCRRHVVPAGQRAVVLAVPVRAALVVLSGFLTNGGPAAAGWTGYAPLSVATYEPGVGLDLWIVGLIIIGFSGVIGSINLIATIYTSGRPACACSGCRSSPGTSWSRAADPVRLPAADGGARDAVHRAQPRRRFLRSEPGWQRGPVAAPVLVLRPSRGLHPDPAVLRRDHGDHLGVQSKAGLRVRRVRVRDGRDREPVHVGLGAPHVHDRRGQLARSSASRRSPSRSRPGSSSSTGSPRCGAAT